MKKKRSWTGYIIINRFGNNTGINLEDGARTGFIEVFKKKELAESSKWYHTEKVVKVIVKEA